MKERHAQLQELQRSLAEGEEMTGRKTEIVEEKKVCFLPGFGSGSALTTLNPNPKALIREKTKENLILYKTVPGTYQFFTFF